jgi:hypothetical protein
MSVHVTDDALVRSNAQRAYLVGYLIGIVHSVQALLEADHPEVASAIQERLSDIYPLIQAEFYPPRSPEPKEPDASKE